MAKKGDRTKKKTGDVLISCSDYRVMYRELFDRNHLPVLIIDPRNGRIIDANKTAESFYHWTKAELIRMKISEINILSPDEIKERMASARSRKENSFHFRHRIKSGEIREVKVESIPVHFAGTDYLFSMIEDITDILEKDSYFRALFEKSPYAIAIMNSDYRINKVNNHFVNLFGYEPSEVIGKSPSDVLYPEGYDQTLTDNIRQIEQGLMITQETRRRCKDGTWIDVELIAMPLYVEHTLMATFAIYVDKGGEMELKSRNQLLASVLENTTEGVVITNRKAEIEWVNEAFTMITGYSHDELIGKNPRIMQSGNHDQAFYKSMWRDILTIGGWSGEIWNRRKSGEIYPEYLKIISLFNNVNDPVKYVGVISDISESKAKEQRLTSLMNRDKLTGLFNRSYMTRAVDREIQKWTEGNTLRILYGDIDNFKSINDNLGHVSGDQILVEIATLMKDVFYQSQVGRVSGDEFIVILPQNTSSDRMERQLGVFFNALEESTFIHGHDLSITCSFGGANYPDNSRDSKELLMNAGIAMHSAKERQGNSYIHFSQDLGEHVKREFAVKTALQHAVYDEEFTLVYQPKIALKTGKTIGSEVLLRWHSKDFGNVTPGEFIPVAEKYGYIYAIGFWVLQSACKEMLQLHACRDGRLTLAVNVSVQQLEKEACSEMVKGILEKTGFPPEQLILEVTEETSISDSERVRASINALVKLGVQISIDDFGTGYSSLEKLYHLQVDELKIDQSFIHHLDRTSDIVRAILAMGKSLHLKVVAEGVETKEQMEFLKEIDCDYAQGFYFSKPKTFDTFKALCD